MIKEIAELYNDDILNKAVSRYGIAKSKLKELGGFESFVYEYERAKKKYILKISHAIRRSVEYVMGELHFVNFLADNGVSVARAIVSENGKLVETISQDDSYFLAYAFEKAKGDLADEEDFNADLYEKWGQIIGKIHAASKKYEIPDTSFKRQEWHEEEILDFDKYVPSSQTIVFEKHHKLLDKLDTLPKEVDSYGLTHGDLHDDNFFIYDGKITAFDFDDCEYHWFTHDIAVALYFALPGPDEAEQYPSFAKYFMQSFMKGYYKENNLDAFWLKLMPDFLKLYDMLQYGLNYQTYDFNNLSEPQRKGLNRRRSRIENEIPIVDINFDHFNSDNVLAGNQFAHH